MARHHVRGMLTNFPDTRIPVVCEPSQSAYQAMAALISGFGLPAPPNEPDLERLLARHASELEAAFIITPHALHHDQAAACLEAGLDVLLEKPMVMNAAEASSLIEVRDRSGRHLVVAFQGSLSPHVRRAAEMLASGELGPILNISAQVWQNWKSLTENTWRQDPAISGGGFLFDTGAHMLNTVADLAGEDFSELAAWFDTRGRPVDILAVIMARLKSGALVTMNACGDTVPSCWSDVRVYTPGAILKTGMWGGFLEVQRSEKKGWQTEKVQPSRGVWEQFLAVRAGTLTNPSPPEVGLRMAHLWDAINASAKQDGKLVPVG
jgi:predicted dehydrogenase